MGDIREQDASYKRGLVLGLTMAEIIVLVLFILLLLLATVVRDIEEELHKNVDRSASLERDIAALTEQLEMVLGRFDQPEKISDLFSELRLLKERAGRVKEMEARVARLTSDLRDGAEAKDLVEELKAAGVVVDDAQSRKDFVDLVRNLTRLVPQAEIQSGKQIEQIAALLRTSRGRIDDLEGQVKNLQTRLGDGGKGTEKPACWADKQTGRTEYIFDIALESGGLRVRDRMLSHRRQAQGALPLQELLYDTTLTAEQFLRQTRSLFDWGEANNCRFFVRAFDKTEANEKSLYKDRMRTLEEHFYKYEMLDEQF